MKTIVLDVVIGLVFVYLIYSLFISIVGEMIATWLGMRARILRQGITNLLTDIKTKKNKSYKLFDYTKDFLLYEPEEFPLTKAGEFYHQPSVKYLTRGVRNSIFFTKKGKPSYISKNNFSSTLIQMLRAKGKGVHDWGKINFAINNNALHLDPDTSIQLQSLLKEADDDMEVFIKKLEDWYDEMMDRITGWYKRKLQLILFWIGFLVVAVLNVDTFEIVEKLSKDKNARDQLVQLSLEAADTTSQISTILNGKDSAVVSAHVKNTFKIVKEDVDNANLILGRGWDYSSITNSQEVKIKKAKLDDLESLETAITSLQPIQESLKSIKSLLDIENLPYDQLNAILVRYKQQQALYDQKLAAVNQKTGRKWDSIDNFSVNEKQIILKGNLKPCPLCKAAFICRNSLWPGNRKFWGFTITALALCLGAPFWFDLLKKLVALRGAGIKPEEKKKEKEDSIKLGTEKKKSVLGKTVYTSDAAEIAIAKFKDFWKSIPGVVSVNKYLHEEAGVKKGAIEVVIEEGFDHHLIKSPVEIELNDTKLKVDIIKSIGSKAKFLMSSNSKFEGQLRHKNTNNWGTCAGVVINKKSINGLITGRNRKCLLCCAHVLQSDNSPYIRDKKDVILDHNGNPIAKVFNLIKSNFIDAAIADLDKQKDIPGYFKPIPPIYKLSKSDRRRREVFIYNNRDGGAPTKATILDDSYEFVFENDTSLYEMYDLIKIGKKENGKFVSVTDPGDSGALVTTCVNGQERSVGIVVGGISNENMPFSFLIRMQDIFDALHIEPMKNIQAQNSICDGQTA